MKRTAGKAEKVRNAGRIPAVVYGPDMSPVAVSVDYREFEKLYRDAGESSLVDCAIEGEKAPVSVLVGEVQVDPVKRRVTHVDFRQIKMDKEMAATIALKFVGESGAVKGLGGTFLKAAAEIHARCLPKDLVGHIDVDITPLKTFTDTLHIKDLILPPGITVADDPDMVVAKVLAPLTEEQIKAMEEEGKKGVEAVEIEKKEKKEGEEEGAEGEKVEKAEKKEEAPQGKKEEKK